MILAAGFAALAHGAHQRRNTSCAMLLSSSSRQQCLNGKHSFTGIGN